MTESDKWSAATICVLDTCHGVRGREVPPVGFGGKAPMGGSEGEALRGCGCCFLGLSLSLILERSEQHSEAS